MDVSFYALRYIATYVCHHASINNQRHLANDLANDKHGDTCDLQHISICHITFCSLIRCLTCAHIQV